MRRRTARLYFLLALIGAGIALAAWQYIRNRSLWLDEASLALNILDRGFAGLLHPLDYNQSAPIGFLWAEKLAVILFGGGEYALRLFPFLCYLASLPLIYLFTLRLAEEDGDGAETALLATALFSLALAAIGYASEVKQYMSDVCVALLLSLLALRHRPGSRASLALLGFAGSVAVFVSNISAVILPVAGLWLCAREARARGLFRLAPVMAAWAAAFLIFYLAFVKGHPSKAYMTAFWSDAFLPPNPFARPFYAFLFNAPRLMYQQVFGFHGYWAPVAAFALISLAWLIRDRRIPAVLFLAGPFAAHLLLSALKLYPFYGRFLLYTAPFATALLALGAARAGGWLGRFHRAGIAFPLLLPLAMLPPLRAGYPVDKEEVKTCLRYLAGRPGGEPVYAYYSAVPALEYYMKTGRTDPELRVVRGGWHREDLSAYDAELDSLRGTVWLLFSHVYPFRPEDNEETYMLGRLSNAGGRVSDSLRVPGASLYRVETNRITKADQ